MVGDAGRVKVLLHPEDRVLRRLQHGIQSAHNQPSWGAEIRNFSGSLLAKGATKGVFITTSTFGPRARQTAEGISPRNQIIRLIDGPVLAKLMIEHGVGVVTETVYEVKKLDANYFADF